MPSYSLKLIHAARYFADNPTEGNFRNLREEVEQTHEQHGGAPRAAEAEMSAMAGAFTGALVGASLGHRTLSAIFNLEHGKPPKSARVRKARRK